MSRTDPGRTLVDRFLGSVIVGQTAPMMPVDPPGRAPRDPSGFAPRLTHGDAAVLKTRPVPRANDGRDAGLEQRTLLRRFQEATGLTTTDRAQRVAKAQALGQFGRLPVERISSEVGPSDAGAVRTVFHRIVGPSPGEYRQRFQARDRARPKGSGVETG